MPTPSLDSPGDSPGSSLHSRELLFVVFGVLLIGGLLVGFSYYTDKHLCSLGTRLVMSCGLVLLMAALFGIRAYAVFQRYNLEIGGAALGVLVMAIVLFSVVNLQAQKDTNRLMCVHHENVEPQSLLQIESAYAQSVSQESESDEIGWTYVGINFGQGWDEKYFQWKEEAKKLPQKGYVLTATGSVHLRKDHIRYIKDEGWVNAESIGIIHPDDKVKVLETKTVADGFRWVKVRRIQGQKKE